MFDLMPFGRRNHDLFRELDNLEKRFFDDEKLGLRPFRADIKDNGDSYILEADLPGFKKEDIQIDIEDSYLTISAQRNEESEEKDAKGNFVRRERFFGSFQRSFNIADVKTDAIDASYKQGVLKLVMPKKEKSISASKRLQIKD